LDTRGNASPWLTRARNMTSGAAAVIRMTSAILIRADIGLSVAREGADASGHGYNTRIAS